MNKAVYGRSSDTYIIVAQTNSGTTPIVGTIVDGLIDFDDIGLILNAGTVAPNTLDGAWKIEVSNDYVRSSIAGNLVPAQIPPTATWVDITASAIWVDAVAAVAHGTAASQHQAISNKYVLSYRALRLTFTPSTGTSTVSAMICLKSRSL